MQKYSKIMHIIAKNSLFGTFCRDKSGNFGIFFAILAVPVLIAVSFALDTSSTSSTRVDLQNAADAAALAVAAAPLDAPIEDLQKLAQGFFYAHKAVVTQKRGVEKGMMQHTVVAEVRATETVVNNGNFLGGTEPVTVGVVSKASMGSRSPEISLVIDSTMRFNAGLAWSEIVKQFDTLLTGLREKAPGGQFRASLVPFVDRVNPELSRTVEWIVEDALVDAMGARVSRQQIRALLRSSFGKKSLLKLKFLKDWDGCVEPREVDSGILNYAQTDNRPAAGFFKPTATKYRSGITAIAGATTCPEPILAQTDDFNALISALSALPMGVNGEGRYDEGLAWGWRTLSPEWKGQWGEQAFPAAANTTRKLVIMMTDGFTGSHIYDFGALGGTWPLGVNNGHPIQFEHMVDLCQRMKADGIEIALFHMIGNVKAEPYFRECASTDMYFKVNSAKDLASGFQALTGSATGTPRLIN